MDQLGQVLKQQGLGALPGGFDRRFKSKVRLSKVRLSKVSHELTASWDTPYAPAGLTDEQFQKGRGIP